MIRNSNFLKKYEITINCLELYIKRPNLYQPRPLISTESLFIFEITKSYTVMWNLEPEKNREAKKIPFGSKLLNAIR